MKSRKVLIGVIVATLVGGMHFANAQPKANYQNNLIEIGPDNIAGRVRALVVDEADATHNTLFAGGVAGGLFMKSGDGLWQYLPYISQGKELTLPISCMVQLPNNDLLIGTGEGFVTNHGVNNDMMAPKGRGLYLFRRSDLSFTQISITNPVVDASWSYINKIAATVRKDNNNQDHLYIYIATDDGLYRWTFDNPQNPEWAGNTPTKVAEGRFLDVIILRSDNIAYATAPGKVLRIGDVINGAAPVDITKSNAVFADAGRIEMAAATSHRTVDGNGVHDTYLYALVADSNGLLEGVYITKDQQNWSPLTTSTVVPFNSKNPGTHNASIAIDPRNYKHIYIGGATLWSGEGFVDNSFYTWTKSSYSENELNAGNYMSNVYSNSLFIHSGIHKIIPTFKLVRDNATGIWDTTWVTYFATDGGVYMTGDERNPFRPLNKGLNTVQFNHIAVSPDGSLIGGAVDNSCPFIQSRNAHNGSTPINEWYDTDSNSIFNHMSNVIWLGNGGGVAASKFQQLAPYTRRALFVSAEPGNFSFTSGMGTMGVASYGRANSDYADYTNTQTWTAAEAFLSDIIPGSNPVPQIKLWETTNNTMWNDVITFNIDTTRSFIRNGEEMPITYNTVFQAGDKILVPSKPNFEYPFTHTFTESHTVSRVVTEYDTITSNGTITRIDTNTYRKFYLNMEVPNKVISRAILNARNVKGTGCVFMTMTPNWFRNVWDVNEANSTDASVIAKLMHWVKVFEADANQSVGDIAWSRDGKSIFINVINNATGKSFIFRLYDFVQADVNNIMEMKSQLNFAKDDPNYPDNPRITHFDSIFADAEGNWFNRPVSCLAVDPRNGQDNLIVTFAGYNNGDPNIILVKNATNPASREIKNISVSNAENGLSVTDPVYSALIEIKNGHLIVGTERGVFKATNFNTPSWAEFGAFNGVPVTSIIQQTDSMTRQCYKSLEGVDTVKYLFAKTKYPYAIYYGTYGRGIFMDTTYVTNMVAETADPQDWDGITTVDNGENHVRIYPNPAVGQTSVEIEVVNAGNATVKIYDITGKMVHSENLGYLNSGVHHYNLDCQKFSHGMYLVNINFGGKSATSKLIVR